jgi:hypothetical protein
MTSPLVDLEKALLSLPEDMRIKLARAVQPFMGKYKWLPNPGQQNLAFES